MTDPRTLHRGTARDRAQTRLEFELLGVDRFEALSARGLRQLAVRGPEFDLITGLVPEPDGCGQVNGIRAPQRILADQPRDGASVTPSMAM